TPRKTKADVDRGTERPKPLRLRPDGIPEFMRAQARFVLWRYVWREKRRKWDKPPHMTDGQLASATAPATWTTFRSAATVYGFGLYDGIGYASFGDDTLTLLALDDAYDSEAGEPLPWAAELLREVRPVYAEVSPSGTGVRAVVRGRWDCKRHKFPCGDGVV